MNPALNHPAPFPLRDHVRQTVQSPSVSHRKLSSILPHVHCNKAIYISDEAWADCTKHANSRDPTQSILTGLVPDSGERHDLAGRRPVRAPYISDEQAGSTAQSVRLGGCLQCKGLVHRYPWKS